MSKYGTTYVESEAILAAQAEDHDEVERIVAEMLPGERRALSAACYRVLDYLQEAERERHAQQRVDRKKAADA